MLSNLTQDEDEDEDDGEEYDFIPKMGCLKVDAWEYAIESAADRILWDRDFEMESDLGGMGGGSRQVLMQFMHIDQGYFQAYQGQARPGARDRLYNMCYGLCD